MKTKKEAMESFKVMPSWEKDKYFVMCHRCAGRGIVNILISHKDVRENCKLCHGQGYFNKFNSQYIESYFYQQLTLKIFNIKQKVQCITGI